MKSNITIKPLVESLYQTYIEVGILAYRQHYLHLWKEGDPTPYLENSFTPLVLLKEMLDPNTELYIIYHQGEAAGILKITKSYSLEGYGPKQVLFLDKIYILNAHTGRGIGQHILESLIRRAKKMNKKSIALVAMKNGPALHFYLKNDFKIHKEIQHWSPSVLEDQRAMCILFKPV